MPHQSCCAVGRLMKPCPHHFQHDVAGSAGKKMLTEASVGGGGLNVIALVPGAGAVQLLSSIQQQHDVAVLALAPKLALQIVMGSVMLQCEAVSGTYTDAVQLRGVTSLPLNAILCFESADSTVQGSQQERLPTMLLLRAAGSVVMREGPSTTPVEAALNRLERPQFYRHQQS